jgi:hypothetical protein
LTSGGQKAILIHGDLMSTKQYDYEDKVLGASFKMEVVDIIDSEEKWNTYTLKDGTILKVKQVVVQAARSIDKPIPGSSGEPLYHVKTQTLVTSVVPKDLLFRDGEHGK